MADGLESRSASSRGGVFGCVGRRPLPGTPDGFSLGSVGASQAGKSDAPSSSARSVSSERDDGGTPVQVDSRLPAADCQPVALQGASGCNDGSGSGCKERGSKWSLLS